VSPEAEKYLALLEHRLSLLRDLSDQFVACRKEFVVMDLDGMYRRIAEQEALCQEIQSICPAIDALQEVCAGQLGLEPRQMARFPEDAASAKRIGRLQQEMTEAQAELGRLNQIHRSFLRRSSRTIHVLMNSLENHALTYARPEQAVLAAAPTESRGHG
jgi:hypothetical protein